MTARLCERMKKAGYNAECLHGDVRQSLRDKVMSGFRKGEFEILVATDVAARGIDVDDEKRCSTMICRISRSFMFIGSDERGAQNARA